MIDNLTAALNYAANGYAVFPCKPGTKVPACAHGVKDATSDEAQIERWWTETPAANIGLSTEGLLVVDIDGADNHWLADDPDKAVDLAAAPLSLTPSGGKHFIYRADWGRNTAGKLSHKVDTRGAGGYIVVPPSVLADGRAYRWSDGETPERDKLSVPPSWIADLLSDTVAKVSHNEHQQQPIPEGRRNATLASLGGSLRRMGLPEAEILAALQKANSLRCNPPLADDELRIIANSTARYAVEHAATPEAQAEGAEIAERLLYGNGEFDAAEKPAGVPDPGPIPAELLSPPGFLRDVIEFNLSGAWKPQPVLALAAALSLLATLTGRKVRDTYNTRTNLYCLGVAATGAGKERARDVNKLILNASGLDSLLGPEGVASGSGLFSAVERQPASLFQLDEVGRLLKTLGDGQKNPHLYNIVTVLLKLFTSSGTVYLSDAYADTERNKSIQQPHACLYGTTVPNSLYEGLTAESVTDGFISRLLVFESPANIQKQKPGNVDTVPAVIVAGARYWGTFQDAGGNLSSINPSPIVMPYDVAAESRIDLFDSDSEAAAVSLGEPLGAIWTRAVEKARKLAMLYACSLAPCSGLTITAPAADWGCRLSEYVTRRMIYIAQQWLSENDWEATCKRLLRIVASAGQGGISRSELTRKTQWLRKRDRGDALQALVDGRSIRIQRLETDAPGRPAELFIAV